MEGITRRRALRRLGRGALALAGAGALRPRRAAAQGGLAQLPPEEPVEATLRRLFGGRPLRDGEGRIKLELPIIAEDGGVVPVSVEVTAPAPPLSVRALYLISDRNRRPLNATVRFAPGPAVPLLSANLRLGESTPVRAIAELSDGTLFQARRDVRVTVGGCGG
jgi:sulfur-oxidizing protein SoxY